MVSSVSLRGLAFAAAALVTAGCGDKTQQGGPPPPEVGIITVQDRPVPIELTYMARTAGVREVDVRSGFAATGLLESMWLRHAVAHGHPRGPAH